MNAALLGKALNRAWCHWRPSPTIVPSASNHAATRTPCGTATRAAWSV